MDVQKHHASGLLVGHFLLLSESVKTPRAIPHFRSNCLSGLPHVLSQHTMSTPSSSSSGPQGLSASTKSIAKQLRQTERNLQIQQRDQFLNGGLQWLMEQTIETEPSGVQVRRRRGSLLTEQAVRVHNVIEGGRNSFVRENSNGSNGSNDSGLESGEHTGVKTGSSSEARIDSWVSQHMDDASDPNK